MRYYKCIDNKNTRVGLSDIIEIGRVYKGEFDSENFNGIRIVIDRGEFTFYSWRFIDVTDIIIRNSKLNRVL
jgi:hypothetical protein